MRHIGLIASEKIIDTQHVVAAGYEAVYAFGAGFALVGLALMWSMRPRPGTTAAA